MNTLVACDFFTKSVITLLGVRMAYSLAFIHIGTRKVYLSAPTYHPHEGWVKQQGRNLMMWLDENQLQARFLIHDRDTKFSSGFRVLFASAGIRCLRTPLLAPNANAYAEAWIGGHKREALNHFLCLSLGHLDHVSQAHVRFYNQHRPHQGLGNQTVPVAATDPPDDPPWDPVPDAGKIHCQRFLGGLLRHYYRTAA